MVIKIKTKTTIKIITNNINGWGGVVRFGWEEFNERKKRKRKEKKKEKT